MPTIADSWIREGIEKGREEGREEGIEEGIEKTALKMIENNYE